MKNVLLVVLLGLALCLPQSGFANLPIGYESLTYSQKYAHLLRNISEGGQTQTLAPTAMGEFWGLLKPSFLAQSFTHVSDELPVGRKKLLHAYGVTAGVYFESSRNHPFTGLFDTGAYGFARLSVAHVDGSDISPGLALKFLVSNTASVNLHAMVGWMGQGNNFNLLSQKMKTHIPIPSNLGFIQRQVLETYQITVRALNALGSGPADPNAIPLMEMASVFPDGSHDLANAVYPDRLEFIPTALAQQKSDSTVNSALPDFRTPIKSGVTPGTVLYEVFAIQNQGGTQSRRLKIGKIITRTPFYSTEYQDKHLFFRHSSVLR